MKLKIFLYSIAVSMFISISIHLITNTRIILLSEQLSSVNSELVKLQLEKELTSNLYQEKFSIENIEKISKGYNFKKLDVFVVNTNLISPYKLNEEISQVSVLGFFNK